MLIFGEFIFNKWFLTLNIKRKKLLKIQNHRPTIILRKQRKCLGGDVTRAKNKQKKQEQETEKKAQEIENQVNCAPEVGVASFTTPLPIAQAGCKTHTLDFQINELVRLSKLKFMFSKKATKVEKIFILDLTLCSKCQIDGEIWSIFVAFSKNVNFICFPFFMCS